MKQLVFFVLRDGQDVYDRAYDLFATSVQDMQSGLWQYETFEDLKVLEMARLLSEDFKEKTREKVLSRRIDRVLRDAGLEVRRRL